MSFQSKELFYLYIYSVGIVILSGFIWWLIKDESFLVAITNAIGVAAVGTVLFLISIFLKKKLGK